MKVYVLFHGGCYDGFTAAWVAHTALQGDMEYIPVNYGQPPPVMEKGARLYILDFSYKREVMQQLMTNASRTFVLDHHKTAQGDLAGLDKEFPDNEIIFDITKSGARLTWEFFYEDNPIPGIVAFTEDRDLWLWNLPDSREVNACLRSYPFDFSLWSGWGVLTPEVFRALMAPGGSAILRREQQIVDQHVKHATETTIAGYKVLSVNATVLFSEIAGELAKGRPFGCAYFTRADGKLVYSLRSASDGIDVSEVAKRFGGGGHKHAAGFET